MLSRIADSLFWLNRYVERSDTVMRIVSVHYILSLDRSSYNFSSWKPVLELCTPAGGNEISTIEHNSAATLRMILFDETNANSVCNIVGKARENARGAQDHLTKEVWEAVNQMYHLVNDPEQRKRVEKEQALKVMEAFTRSTVLFAGITDNTMWRGLGWNFMQLGKFIERCLQSIAIIRKQLDVFSETGTAADDILRWRYLLLALSGYEMHLKNYRSDDHTNNVLQQIFLDENFTRSLVYSLIRVKHYTENIMAIHEEQNKDLVRNFGRLYSKVRYMELRGMDNKMLSQFLQELNTELTGFSYLLSQHYFSYS